MFFQILAENLNKSTIEALVVNEAGSKLSQLKAITRKIPGVKVNLACVRKSDLVKLTNIEISMKFHVLLLSDLSFDETVSIYDFSYRVVETTWPLNFKNSLFQLYGITIF